MEHERFELFSSHISGIYRDIQKLKAKWTEPLGMKAVHIFWVYLLRSHPEGLTASELSRHSQSNRSLVSREIQELIDLGYVCASIPGTQRRYRQKLALTEKGQHAAETISRASFEIQNAVSSQIPQEDLLIFYRTLGILLSNFDRLTQE